MTDRRSFLRGALTLTFAAVAAPALAALDNTPVIYCDGVHDDAPGLSALLSGRPVRIEGEIGTALEGYVRGADFTIWSTVVASWNGRIKITECNFVAMDPFVGDYMLCVSDASGVEITYCHFDAKVLTRRPASALAFGPLPALVSMR